MRILVLAVALAGCARNSGAAGAQTGGACLQEIRMQQVLLEAATRLGTSSGADADRLRNAYQLPKVAASEISLVREDSVCLAVAELRRSRRPATEPAHIFPVVLVRIGRSRYLMYEGRSYDGRLGFHVLDADYTTLTDVVH